MKRKERKIKMKDTLDSRLIYIVSIIRCTAVKKEGRSKFKRYTRINVLIDRQIYVE